MSATDRPVTRARVSKDAAITLATSLFISTPATDTCCLQVRCGNASVGCGQVGFDSVEGGVECSGVFELEGLGGVDLVGAGGVHEASATVRGATRYSRQAELGW